MAEQVELDISIAALKQDLVSFQNELSKTGKIGNEAFGSISDEVAAVTKEMQDLSQVQKEAAADISRSGTAVGSFGARVKAAILDTQVFGKSVGEWGGQIGGVISRIGGGAAAVGRFSGVFKTLGTVIKATGLGLLIGVVGSLISYFTKFGSGVDKVNQIMAGIGAVVDVVIKRFLSLASAIGNLFSGNFSAAADDLKASVSGIGAELVNAASAAYELEKAFQRLRDDSRTAGAEFARQAVQLAKLKQIADDETRSLGQRAAAQKQAATIEAGLMETRLELAQRTFENEQKRFFLNTENAEQRDAAAKAEIEYYGVVAEAATAQADNEKRLREIQVERREKAAKALKDEADSLEQVRKALEKLRVESQAEGQDKELAAVTKKYDDLQRVVSDGVERLSKIEKRRGLTAEETAQKEEFARLSVELEQRRQDALIEVLLSFSEKQTQIEEEQFKQREALKKKDLDALIKSIENEKVIRDSQLDQGEEAGKAYLLRLKAQGASKREIDAAAIEFDLLTQQARVKAEIDFQQKMLDAIAASDPQRAAAIKASIESLRAQLSNIDFQIANPEKQKKEPFSLAKLMGVDPENVDEFNKAVETVVAGLQQLSEARVKAAQAAVEAAEKEVDVTQEKVEKAEEALDREIALAETGFASDVTRKRAELAEAEKADALAKARRDKALEEQRKAQRAQILLDTVLQSSNLITASTQVIKGFSFIPIAGVPLGIAAVALMIGSFIKSKLAALQAVKAREGIQGEVGRDGIVVGPSHDNGGVPLEVEGGEFVYQGGRRISVVKRRATAMHHGLLMAINNDDRPAMVRYLERLTGGVSRNTRGVESRGEAPSGRSSSSSSKLDTLMEENNRLTRKLVELEENRTEYVDMGSHILKRHKGREEKIMKR